MDGPEGATLYHPKQSNPFKGMLYQQLLHDIGTDAQGSGGVNKNPWLLQGAGMDSKAVGCRIPSPGEQARVTGFDGISIQGGMKQLLAGISCWLELLPGRTRLKSSLGMRGHCSCFHFGNAVGLFQAAAQCIQWFAPHLALGRAPSCDSSMEKSSWKRALC